MDSEETLRDNCENLMTAVVETRKRFGRKCIDYQSKTSRAENQLLQIRLDSIHSYGCKSKKPPPLLDFDEKPVCVEDIKAEIMAKELRVETLTKRLNDAREVMMQVKYDMAKRLHQPVTKQAIIARSTKSLQIIKKTDGEDQQ